MSRNRIVSVHDPEMCHGRKSRSQRFDGHKAAVGVDPESQLFTDAAYGDGHTRQQFADAGRTLIAKVPKRPARAHFPKEDFQIDLAARTCTCPAGQVTRTVRRRGSYTTATGERAPPALFPL